MLHKFEFKTEQTGKPTYIYLDGKQLEGVTHAHVDWSCEEFPQVTLTFLTTNITIDGEDMEVKVKSQ